MLGIPWKDVEPFLGLMLTTAVLLSSRALLGLRSGSPEPKLVGWDAATLDRKRKVVMAGTAGLVAAFLALVLVLVLLKVPSMLQHTHPRVAAQKAAGREQCLVLMQDMDILGAEVLIRDSALSKSLALEFEAKQRKTLDRALRPLTNQLFFRTGAFCSMLPFFLALVASLALSLGGADVPALRALRRLLPSKADYAFVLLPLMDAVAAYTWLTVAGFHLWLRERQVTTCMLLSGHWYTALACVVTFAAGLLFLRVECSLPGEPGMGAMGAMGERRWTRPGSALPYYFAAWLAVYAALTSRTLSSSQQFHHDWQESVSGIKGFAMVMLFALPMAAAVLLSSVGFAKLAVPDDADADASSQGAGSTEAKPHEASKPAVGPTVGAAVGASPLRAGAAAAVLQEFAAEGDGELSVAVGETVQLLAAEVDGWVHARAASGKTGFVPAAFLGAAAKPFELDQPTASAEAAAGTGKEEKKKGEALSVSEEKAAEEEPAGEKPAKAKAKAKAKAEAKDLQSEPTRRPPAFLAAIAGGKVELKHSAGKKVSPTEPAKRASSGGGGGGGMFGELQAKLAENREMINPTDDDAAAAEEWK